MKKLKLKLVLIFAITLIVLFFILKNDFYDIVDILLKSKIIYIVFAIIVTLISDIFRSIHMYLLIRVEKKDYTFKDALMITIESNFFNGITPFSLGGQPFQLYCLKKKNNIDYTTGANILFKDFYSYQLAFVTLGIVLLIINSIFGFTNFSRNILLRKLMILGLLINIGIVVFIFYLTYKKGDNHKIINKIIVFLNKIKIIKNKDSVLDKADVSLKKFKMQINEIRRNKKLMMKCYLLNILKLLAIGTVGGICFSAVGVNTISIYRSIVSIILIMIMAAFVPIPGSSGGMEYGFVAFFSGITNDPVISAAMLLWRFVSYYFLMIIGGILFMYENRK